MTLLYLGSRVAVGDEALALSQRLAAGEIPGGLLAALAWLNLITAFGLTYLFRAWAGDAPLADLRYDPPHIRARFLRDLGLGLALGLASMLLVLAVQVTFGWAALSFPTAKGASYGSAVLLFFTLLPAAAAEEVVFRGYLLQTLQAWRGWFPALFITSILFGLAHAANPHVTVLALINIALAGIVLGLTVRATRRLWLATAYHFMWNFAQGPLLGFPVSGLGFEALLQTRVSGPAWWTGGDFGPEGGLIATAILLVTAVVCRRAR